MNEAQERLFNLLIEIDDLCSQHNIDYCLAGGSALGAIRNQCFLPWDDDIDLYITRDNWNKLFDVISKNPELLPKNRDLVCIENSKYYRNPIARYIDTSTTNIFLSQSVSANTCGTQIEFFILDPIPKIEEGQEEHLKKLRAFLEIITPSFLTERNITLENYAEHKDLVLKYYEKIDKEGHEKVFRQLYDELFTYPLEKADTFCMRWGKRTLMHKTDFYEGKRFEELEGRKFPVAYKLEHMLRVDYGDTWMYIPEPSGQLSHAPLIKDMNRPFKDYTDIYLPHIDRDEIIHNYEIVKRTNLKNQIPKTKVNIEKTKMRGVLVKKEIYEKIKIDKYNPKELLENKEFKKLDDLFNDFYSIQLSKISLVHNILVDIDLNLFKIAIENKLKQGMYHSAINIIKILESNEIFDEDLKSLKETCYYCKDLSINIYDNKDVEIVEKILQESDNSYETLIDTYRAKLWLSINKSKVSEDYEKIILDGTNFLNEYPNDGEIMAYIAEAYYQLGKKEKAYEMYNQAVQNTRNGFVWQYAKKRSDIDKMIEEGDDVN